MTPTFIDVGRRLVIRYADPDARTFSFQKIRIGASSQGMYDVANAFASVQNEIPSKVSTVLTRRLF